MQTHEYDNELHCSLTREFGVYTTYMTYVIQTHKYDDVHIRYRLNDMYPTDPINHLCSLTGVCI